MNDSTSPTPSKNLDPITGEPGAHPLGTGVGAAGAGAAGAAIGAVAGPIGAVVGAAIGAVAGGLAGHGVAESIDPTEHDAYWQQNHANQPYASTGDYSQYSGAYRTGYTGAGTYAGKNYSDVEGNLKADYEKAKDSTAVGWEHAKEATKAAFTHASQKLQTAGEGTKDASL